ncbi:trypsin-like serine protease [Anaerolineales bacterium HSG25]|nr:trypsin-like serine protease [Anaerolineales bacterium HSG25]
MKHLLIITIISLSGLLLGFIIPDQQNVNLVISKVGPGKAEVSDHITYTLKVTNIGSAVATGLVVTDTLPPLTNFVSASHDGILQGDMVEWSNLADLQVGQSLNLQLTVLAPTTVPKGDGARNFSPQNRAKSPRRAVEPRIVGGEVAQAGDWPWQVALIKSHINSTKSGYYCSGTILDAEWILTAAHCVESSQTNSFEIDVVAGRQTLSSNEGVRIPIESSIIHPDYDNFTLDFDLALLKLSSPLTLGDSIQPVTLIDPADKNLFAPKVLATVAGWGALSYNGSYPDQLYQVSVPIVSNQDCSIPFDALYGANSITANMLCAGYAEGGQDGCQGDSGAGMVVANQNKDGYLLVGITSWGYECARANYYGVYTRVSQFLDWIEKSRQDDELPVNAVVNQHFGVRADGNISVRGSDVVITRITSRPNLISSFEIDPPYIQFGQPVTVSLTVTNTGHSTANNFFVDFYVEPTQAPLSAMYWGELGSPLSPTQGIEWQVKKLAPGQSIRLTSSNCNSTDDGQAPLLGFTTWNGSFLVGTENLYSYADSDGDGNPNGLLLETNEADNQYHIDLNELPDILDISVSGPTSAMINEPITYTLIISNEGEHTLNNLVITDRVPIGSQFLQAANNGMLDSDVVSWSLASLPAQSTATVQFSVVADDKIQSARTNRANQPRIIGGEEANPGDWPWQAALIRAGTSASSGHYCAGSLIRDDWVLTAGHCTDGKQASQIEVILGRHNLATNEGQRFQVVKIINNPFYHSISLESDIALLQLDHPATLNNFVQLIDIPEPDSSLMTPNTPATVTGWGNLSSVGSNYPDALHQVSVPLVSNETCNQAFPGEVSDNMICAGYIEGGKDACQGDSGGPLVVLKDDQQGYTQVGIVSWGEGCALAGYYGVYTRLANFKTWVEEKIGPPPSPSKTIINHDYRVSSGKRFSAMGKTSVSTNIDLDYKYFDISDNGGMFILDSERTITITPNTFAKPVTLIYDNQPITFTLPFTLDKVGVFYNINATDSTRQDITPQQPYSVSISYSSANLDGLDESTLALYYLNEEGVWIKEPTSILDMVNQRCWATPQQMGSWAILGQIPIVKTFLPTIIK